MMLVIQVSVILTKSDDNSITKCDGGQFQDYRSQVVTSGSQCNNSIWYFLMTVDWLLLLCVGISVNI